MRLIIAGGRNVDQFYAFFLFLCWWKGRFFDKEFDELVTGCCSKGPDQIPFMLDDLADTPYNIKEFPADWETHGRSAGPKRNREMAEYADELVVIWDGKSRGSKNMISEMKKLGKPVHEV